MSKLTGLQFQNKNDSEAAYSFLLRRGFNATIFGVFIFLNNEWDTAVAYKELNENTCIYTLGYS